MSSGLRFFAVLGSLALHGLLVLVFVGFEPGGASFETGEGNELMNIEQGIAIEGFAKLGEDEATVEAVEAPQTQLSEARPEIKEVEADKPVEEPPPPEIEAAELPEETEVVKSVEGPEQDPVKPKEPERKELEQPQPKQVATLDQPEELAVVEERSSGVEQKGGSTTLSSAYLGSLRSHLERRKVNPRSRETGTVIVRFTLDPNGQIISREVSKSSGSRTLDDAAVASLDRASPFPAFPSGVRREPLVVSVPFRFMTR